MGRVGFIKACFTVILLGLSSQAMAQGQLAIEPHPLDSITSPHPLGPVQKFGDFSPGYVATFSIPPPAVAPAPRQAQTAHNGQAQTPRRQSARAVLRPIALRSSARQQEARHAGPVLSLAPRYGERLASTPFCFPASTLHIQQDERCNVGAPTYRGRFEELLGE